MKQFTLYKRPTKKKNKYIYYVQFRDSNGNRMTAVSSGATSKSKAETWAINQLVNGLAKTSENPKFSTFAKNWFIWGKCKYLERQINRRDYPRSYAEHQRRLLVNHILPYFADYKLSNIGVIQIEDWLLSLRKTRSSSTANRLTGRFLRNLKKRAKDDPVFRKYLEALLSN